MADVDRKRKFCVKGHVPKDESLRICQLCGHESIDEPETNIEAAPKQLLAEFQEKKRHFTERKEKGLLNPGERGPKICIPFQSYSLITRVGNRYGRTNKKARFEANWSRDRDHLFRWYYKESVSDRKTQGKAKRVYGSIVHNRKQLETFVEDCQDGNPNVDSRILILAGDTFHDSLFHDSP